MKNQLRKILSLIIGILIYFLLLILALPITYPIYLLAIGDGTILGHVTNNQELLATVSKIPLMILWSTIVVFTITFLTVQITERQIKVKYRYNWLLTGVLVTLMFSKSIYPYNKFQFVASCLFGMLGACIGFKRNRNRNIEDNQSFESDKKPSGQSASHSNP